MRGGYEDRLRGDQRIGTPRISHPEKDCDNHGYTKGCAGCNSWFRCLVRQPHSDACRERFSVLLKDNARYINAKARKEDREEAGREDQAQEESGRRW